MACRLRHPREGIRTQGGCAARPGRVRGRAEAARAVTGGDPDSVANVDLVRSICTAWERGDFGSTDWADPEIEWVSREGPAPDRRAGLADVRTGYREFLHDWENLRWETEECRVLGA